MTFSGRSEYLEQMNALLLALSILSLQDDTAQLVEQLRSDTVSVREEAARRLKRLGPAARSELEKATKDPDGEVAARAQRLLLGLSLREKASPGLRKAMPGVEERLDTEDLHVWTEVFLESVQRTEGKLRFPDLKDEDLEPLAVLALRGARTAEEKIQIAKVAGRRGFRSLAMELVPLLKDGDWNVHWEAGSVLKQLDAKEAIPAIIAILDDPGRGPWEVLSTLVDLRALEAIPRFVKLLEEANKNMPGSGANALVALRAREAIPAVRRLLAHKEVIVVQRTAWVLGRLRAREAVPDLLELLDDPRPGVQEAAMHALGSLRVKEAAAPYVRRALAADDFSGPRALSPLLFMHPREAIPVLIRLAGDEKCEVRSQTFAALCNMRAREAIPFLTKWLEDKDPQLVLPALRSLSFLRAREASGEIARLLDHPSYGVREAAVWALSEFGSREFIPEIRKRLSDPEREVCWAAILAVQAFEDKDAAPVLMHILEHREDSLRADAARALGFLQVREAVPALLRRLKDPSTHARREAAQALARLGTREAIPRLREMAGAESEQERCAVLQGLIALGERDVLPAMVDLLRENSFYLSKEVISALGDAHAKEALPSLANLLKDPDRGIRADAIRAILEIRSAEGIPLLAALLKDRDPHVRSLVLNALNGLRASDAIGDIEALFDDDYPHLGWSAIQIAGNAGLRQFIPRLIAGLRDRSSRGMAAGALGSLKAREAIPQLIELLDDPEEGVRLAVLGALEWLEAREAHAAVVRLLDEETSTRIAAATWLSRMGFREGARVIFEESWDWTSLNALRRPKVWTRLSSTSFHGDLLGTTGEMAGRMAREAGLNLEGPRFPRGNYPWSAFRKRIANPGDRMTLLEGLKRAADGYQIILEEDRVWVLPWEEALGVWKDWFVEEEKRK